MSLEEQSNCDKCFKHFAVYDDNLIWAEDANEEEIFPRYAHKNNWIPKKGKITHEDMVKAFEKESEASALCIKCIKELK